MIYGEPPYHIDDDTTDRIGIRTLVVSKMWQPSRWPLTLAELDEEAPAPPAVPGGVVFIGRQTRLQRGVLRTVWTFEGVNGDGKSVTFKDRSNSLDYEFQPGFSEVDIALHPNLQKLLDEYDGSAIDGQIYFPPTISGTSGGAGLAGGSGEAEPNPMYGVKDFLRTEGTYHFRYGAVDLNGLNAGVGRIHSGGALPGRPPSYPGRDWLQGPSPYRRRGPIFEITDVFYLSGPGGWPEPVYRNGGGKR